MSVIQHLRQNILGINQKELAAIAETSQGTVSRWETGELHPDLAQLAKIRNHVIALGKNWDDSWFFDLPASTEVKRPDDPIRPAAISIDDDFRSTTASQAAE